MLCKVCLWKDSGVVGNGYWGYWKGRYLRAEGPLGPEPAPCLTSGDAIDTADLGNDTPVTAQDTPCEYPDTVALVVAFDSPGVHAQEDALCLLTGNDWEGAGWRDP